MGEWQRAGGEGRMDKEGIIAFPNRGVCLRSSTLASAASPSRRPPASPEVPTPSGPWGSAGSPWQAERGAQLPPPAQQCPELPISEAPEGAGPGPAAAFPGGGSPWGPGCRRLRAGPARAPPPSGPHLPRSFLSARRRALLPALAPPRTSQLRPRPPPHPRAPSRAPIAGVGCSPAPAAPQASS